ncbi:MAG: hypothetical protein PHI98_10870 [Eubacteriales bacterium]|nr:hypothetical protein [Eubacteriales bacterium]
MKRRLFTILLILAVTFSGVALGEYTVTAPDSIRLGGTGDDSIVDILALANGDLILSLSTQGGFDQETEYGNNIRKAWLLRLSTDGVILWQTVFAEEKGYTSFGYTTFSALEDNGDGTFSGVVHHSVNQSGVYTQPQTRSLKDGSLISEGEKTDLTKRDPNINTHRYQDGQLVLQEEIHDAGASCEPCYLTLFDENGTERWMVTASDIGIKVIAGMKVVTGGVILYGKQWIDDGYRIVALRINDDGTVGWRYCPSDIPDGDLDNALVDSDGRFVGVGFARSAYAEDTGWAFWLHVNLCLDTQTGEVIWRRFYEVESNYRGRILEWNDQYLLLGNPSFTVMDREGYLRGSFMQSPQNDYIGWCTPFQWGDQLWVEKLLKRANGTQDAMLERLEVPKDVADAPRLEPAELPVSETAEAQLSEEEQRQLDELVVAKTAEWEQELGFFGLWPLEKKVEFCESFGSAPSDYSAEWRLVSMPEEGDVTVASVLSQAKEILKSKFELTDAQIEAYQPGVEFYAEGEYDFYSGSDRTLLLSLFRSAPETEWGYFPDFFIYAPSPDGEIKMIRNLDAETIMSWGIGKNAAFMLTELGSVCYNPDGGNYFHIDRECVSMKPEYWSKLVELETGLLPTKAYRHLKQCPVCLPGD